MKPKISQEELDSEFVKFVFSLVMKGEEKIFFSQIKRFILNKYDTEKESQFVRFADENGLRVIF
jgi:transcriptional regulator NrdR family protein